MKKKHLVAYNLLLILCFSCSTLFSQSTKKHTERFMVNGAVDIHVNTTHANVVFETSDKNEVEVTFKLEADEKVAEYFEKWKTLKRLNKIEEQEYKRMKEKRSLLFQRFDLPVVRQS